MVQSVTDSLNDLSATGRAGLSVRQVGGFDKGFAGGARQSFKIGQASLQGFFVFLAVRCFRPVVKQAYEALKTGKDRSF